MKYQRIEQMTEREIKEVLQIIYPDTIYRGYRKGENEIIVFFEINGKQKKCTYLSDWVEDIPEEMPLSPNEQYEYRKYMVARGYSEFWVNNRYGIERCKKRSIYLLRILYPVTILYSLRKKGRKRENG